MDAGTSPFVRRKGMPSIAPLSPHSGRSLWSSRSRTGSPVSPARTVSSSMSTTTTALDGQYARCSANGISSRRRKASPSPSSSAGSEMMSRLGLLFGADARNAERSPSSNSGGGGGGGGGSATLMSARSNDSSSSMKSFDANRLTSSNASPVSTLTGAYIHYTLHWQSSK